MIKTKFYVHSDVDDNNIYAEFDNQVDAIYYASGFSPMDKCYVVEATVDVDEESGEVLRELESEKIWSFEDLPTEDAFGVNDWPDVSIKDEEEMKLDTDFDVKDIHEELEAREDLVECQHCFDLFPKEECTKIEYGYLCPHCHSLVVKEVEFPSEMIDDATFGLEFPEPCKFDDDGDEDEISDEYTEIKPEEPTFVSADETSEAEGTVGLLTTENDEPAPEFEQDTFVAEGEPEVVSVETPAAFAEMPVTVEGAGLDDGSSDDSSDDSDEILDEHVQDRPAPVEDTTKIQGGDNAVVDCETEHKIIAHSEDEKPLDCLMKKPALEEPIAGEKIDIKINEDLEKELVAYAASLPENLEDKNANIELLGDRKKLFNESYPDMPFDSDVKEGDKIRIIHLEGEDDSYNGKEGTVDHIDSIGQLHGTWGGLAVIPGVDDFEIISEGLKESKYPGPYSVVVVDDETADSEILVDPEEGYSWEECKEIFDNWDPDKMGYLGVEHEVQLWYRDDCLTRAFDANGVEEPLTVVENLKEDFDDPDYWSDKIGPTYLISYDGKPVCYIRYPYAGDPAYGGKEPSDKEILASAKEVLGTLDTEDIEDPEIDDAKISYVGVDEDEHHLDLETIHVDYKYTECLKEAKKDEEEPVDPEQAKLDAHTMLNQLVADEIEAIDGYEASKAELLDKPLEHKEEIIHTIDHIKDEEKEHIDELINATKKIPFEKPAVEELEEASSAEKKAYKDGGEAYADYIQGKAIARIKDKDMRDAAIALKKAEASKDALNRFVGDRKENQAIDAFERKQMKMQAAGVTEDLHKNEEALVAEWARQGVETGMIFDESDYDQFAKICKIEGIEPSEELFKHYFKCIDDLVGVKEVKDESLEFTCNQDLADDRFPGWTEDGELDKPVAMIDTARGKEIANREIKEDLTKAQQNFLDYVEAAIRFHTKALENAKASNAGEDVIASIQRTLDGCYKDKEDFLKACNKNESLKEEEQPNLDELEKKAHVVDYVEYKHSYCHVLEPMMKKINYLANVVKKPVNYIKAVVRNTIKQSPEVRWTDKEQWFMSKLNEFWPDSYELYKFIKNSIEKAHDTWVYVDDDGELIPELNADMISIPVGESLIEDLEDETTDTLFDTDEELEACAWCGEEYPVSDLHKEVDLGYLCPSCEQAIKSRGEKLTFEE